MKNWSAQLSWHIRSHQNQSRTFKSKFSSFKFFFFREYFRNESLPIESVFYRHFHNFVVTGWVADNHKFMPYFFTNFSVWLQLVFYDRKFSEQKERKFSWRNFALSISAHWARKYSNTNEQTWLLSNGELFYQMLFVEHKKAEVYIKWERCFGPAIQDYYYIHNSVSSFLFEGNSCTLRNTDRVILIYWYYSGIPLEDNPESIY